MKYDRVACSYDKLMSPLEKLALRGWRKETVALLPENVNILELGAGTGLNFEHYPKFQNAVATDLSFEMLTRARSRTDSIKYCSVRRTVAFFSRQLL